MAIENMNASMQEDVLIFFFLSEATISLYFVLKRIQSLIVWLQWQYI